MLTFSFAGINEIEHGNTYPEVTAETYKDALSSTDEKKKAPAFDYPVQAAYATIFKGKGEAFMDALLQRQGEFEQMITVLMRHGNDPDFWRPTGHAA